MEYTLKVWNKYSNNLVFNKSNLSVIEVDKYINTLIDTGLYQLVNYKVIKEEI